jgi:hypothetical protein
VNFIKALNSISSQWWAGFLLTSGVGTLWLANFAHANNVASALVSAGGGMVGGAMILFQHQQKDNPAADTTTETLTSTKEQT